MGIKLENKVVVVTGASAGIGAALTEALAVKGAKVVLAARNAEALGEVAARSGGTCAIAVADVTRREDVHQILATAFAHFGRVDVWINNAGQGISRMLEELTDEDVDTMIDVNLKSALYGMQAVLPHFKERGSGVLVNVSSMLSRMPMAPQRSAYSAAKAALNVLSEGLRLELSQLHPGIRVMTVLPGIVATGFGDHARHGGEDSRALPGGQTAEEVAAAIVRGLEQGREDLYTRSEGVAPVLGYLEGLADARR